MIKMEFENFYDNVDFFSNRQIWMNRILKNYEAKLRYGNINLDHDNMIYNINLKMNDPDALTILFQNIENSMLNEESGKTVLDIFENIITLDDINKVKTFSLKK